MITEENLRKMMEVVEQYTPEEGRIKIHFIMNGNHNDEYTANAQIAHMVPPGYIGTETKPHNMHEYLSMVGLTPDIAFSIVNEAWTKAKEIASRHGFEAPHLTANIWDCYLCITRMLSDYWATASGDLDVAALLAYQYLTGKDR